MISCDEFTRILGQIEQKGKKIDEICDVLGDCDKLFNTMMTDEVVTLLMHIFDDRNEWIPYWVWELSFGKLWKKGAVTDEDGSDIKLQTAKDLYKLLTGNKEKGSNEPSVVFSVYSYGLPDFELTYHPDKGTYSMWLDTLYKFSSPASAEVHLKEVLDKFTKWMKEHHYSTCAGPYDDLLIVSIIMNGGAEIFWDQSYPTISDAYAAFQYMVKNRGETGGTW